VAVMPYEGLLDVGAFAEWLAAHSYDAAVGQACDPEHCPLACWLSDAYGGRWSVGPAGYVCVNAIEQGGNLPVWARQFFRAIDRQFGGSVSANEAFAVLLELAPELREMWRE
jgi:hypothetical protein